MPPERNLLKKGSGLSSRAERPTERPPAGAPARRSDRPPERPPARPCASFPDMQLQSRWHTLCTALREYPLAPTSGATLNGTTPTSKQHQRLDSE